MANPRPSRPWLRLRSIARPVIPEPAPTPAQPRPPLATRSPTQPQATPATAPTTDAPAVQKSPPKPAAGTKSLPPSPVVRTAAPSSSLPTSPARPPIAPVSTTTTTSSLPPSPVAQKPAPSSSVPTSSAPKPMPTASSVPTSPIPRAVPAPAPTTTTRVPTPSPPTRNAKPTVPTSTPESPKPKPTAPPPSPLILPPEKVRSDSEIPLKAEQKTVLVQKTIISNKPKPRINNSSDTDKDQYLKKLTSDSKNGGMRVITIAGENKGAYMEVILSPNKKHNFEGTSHNLLEIKKWGNTSSSSSGSEGEEGNHLKKKDKTQKGKTTNSLPKNTFMNSNVQDVNNSIMYNSTCTHDDPGVHLALSRKSASGGGHGRGFQVKERSNGNQD